MTIEKLKHLKLYKDDAIKLNQEIKKYSQVV